MFSTKGGVGKSTVTVNFGSVMNLENRQVIAMDCDPNNTLKYHYGLSQSHSQGHALSSLTDSPIASSVYQLDSGEKVIPFGNLSESQLIEYEKKLIEDPFYLKKKIDSLHLTDKEILILDAPSGSSIFTQQVLNAANISVLVMLADAASYLTLENSLNLINKHCLGKKDYIGTMYLVNQIQRNHELNSDVFDMVQYQLQNHIIVEIHQDQFVAEALANGMNLMTYAPQSLAAQDFIDAAQTLESYLLGQLN
jgi:cellulose synthase operon protein YhjQ